MCLATWPVKYVAFHIRLRPLCVGARTKLPSLSESQYPRQLQHPPSHKRNLLQFPCVGRIARAVRFTGLCSRNTRRTEHALLLVAGFDAQNFRAAGGFGQLLVLTHEAPGAEKSCVEMAALS